MRYPRRSTDKKVSFSNPGHAINLAKKLNNQFKSTEFTVVLLNAGENVYSDKKAINN